MKKKTQKEVIQILNSLQKLREMMIVHRVTMGFHVSIGGTSISHEEYVNMFVDHLNEDVEQLNANLRFAKNLPKEGIRSSGEPRFAYMQELDFNSYKFQENANILTSDEELRIKNEILEIYETHLLKFMSRLSIDYFIDFIFKPLKVKKSS